MIKPTLYMMVGIPGSGKSTLAKAAKDSLNYSILSSDEYRKNLFCDENDQSHNHEVFEKLHNDMNKLLSEGENVCYDATNIKVSDRRKCLNSIKFPCKKVAVFINLPIEEAKKRNLLRERVVPEGVIDKMYSKLVIPTEDEGFDVVHVINGVIDIDTERFN